LRGHKSTVVLLPPQMKGMSVLFSFCFLQVALSIIVSLVATASPTYRANEVFVANKRSFDRLETSPFDFGGYAKRYSDDDSFDFNRRKKSFDRLETSPFSFGLSKRKRSFDRVSDSPFSFGLNKRSGETQRQEPVRSVYHLHRNQKPLSISELMRQVEQRQQQTDPSLLYYAQ